MAGYLNIRYESIKFVFKYKIFIQTNVYYEKSLVVN